MRKPWTIEAVKAIDPSDIPKAGPDYSDLLSALKETKAAGFSLPEEVKQSTIRNGLKRAIKLALNSTCKITFGEGTIYVELVPAKERKPGPAGVKRGRKPKAVTA